MNGTVKPNGTIRPEDTITTPIVWEKLTAEKKKIFGAMIDLYIAWTQTVPEIMQAVKNKGVE